MGARQLIWFMRESHYWRDYKMTNKISAENLIELWSIETSRNGYVEKVREYMEDIGGKLKELSEGEIKGIKQKIVPIRSRIEHKNVNKGFGYLSSSQEHNREKEILCSAIIADSFKNRDLKTTPLVVPIDNIYSFFPGNASLVYKTELFEDRKREGEYAIILTGITDSEIFTQKVLEQIPQQYNAGLDFFRGCSELGTKLYEFSNGMDIVLERNNGSLKKTLEEIAEKGDLEDAKLFLATNLLLQDKQTWQDLWYEKKGKGTPLYIVAPQTFHDAMNRLNLSWGHGTCDYNYRATFGGHDAPVFGEYKAVPYEEQGLSADDFKTKVGRFLK